MEELYKKELNDPDNYSGVIIHLEPDILEWSSVLSPGLGSLRILRSHSRPE